MVDTCRFHDADSVANFGFADAPKVFPFSIYSLRFNLGGCISATSVSGESAAAEDGTESGEEDIHNLRVQQPVFLRSSFLSASSKTLPASGVNRTSRFKMPSPLFLPAR